jgi:hypothetical protein
MMEPKQVLEEIVAHIKDPKTFAFARFNDGEIGAITRTLAVISRGDQVVTPRMRSKLKRSLRKAGQDAIVGIPCRTCYPELRHFAENVVGVSSRICLATSIQNKLFRESQSKILKALSDSSATAIHWIGSEKHDVSAIATAVGREVKHFAVPHVNAFAASIRLWNRHRATLQREGSVCLLSCGPASRIIALQAARTNSGVVALDIGSLFDPLTRRVFHSYHEDPSSCCTECHGPKQPDRVTTLTTKMRPFNTLQMIRERRVR